MIAKRQVNGVLLLDKPKGVSSNNALQRAKHIFSAAKAGHTGSLDPVATGLLPICFGEATKYAQYLVDTDKTYICHAELGAVTASGDTEQSVFERRETSHLTAALIQENLATFTGEIQQVPSMFSALKQNGQPLYKLARKGITVPREPRSVTVFDLRIMRFDNPEIELYIRCSKGTYVRSLVEDLGERLECGGHVTELRRVGIGHFSDTQAVTLEQLADMAEDYDRLDDCLLPVEASVHQFPLLELSEHQYQNIIHGRKVIIALDIAPGTWRLHGPDRGFIGLGEVITSGELSPKRLLST